MSTHTGRIVARNAAPLFKKLSLELGGKNATIVLDDVDMDTMVPQIVRSGVSILYQTSTASCFVFVHMFNMTYSQLCFYVPFFFKEGGRIAVVVAM